MPEIPAYHVPRPMRLHAGAWLLICLPALAGGCARTPPPEDALRETVGGLHSALQARDAGEVAAFLAEDFIGPEGLDRDGARRMAALHLMRNRTVSAVLGPLDIDLQEGHARVRFSAALVTGAGGALPTSTRVYSVDSGWREDGGDWTLTSMRWEPRH